MNRVLFIGSMMLVSFNLMNCDGGLTNNAGEDGSVCQMAAQHLANCTGNPLVQENTACDAPLEEAANEFLQLNCNEVTQVMASGAKFDCTHMGKEYHTGDTVKVRRGWWTWKTKTCIPQGTWL